MQGVWGEGLSARSVGGMVECKEFGGKGSVDGRVVSELEAYYNCVLKIC